MLKLAQKILCLWVALGSSYALADYNHEINGYLDFTSASGKVSSGSTNTKLNDRSVKGNLGYGYFVSSHVEPVVDVTLNNLSKTTGDYDNAWNNTEWNLGVLFNSPDRALEKDKPTKAGEESSPLSSSRWIPYGGFLVGSRANSQTIGVTSGSERIMLSKLTAGVRYLLYPHIAMNVWVKASYENSSAKATADGSDSTGVVSKLILEFRLFSLSVLF
jgi:hypothetical protein